MIEFIGSHPGAIMQLLAIFGGAITALASGTVVLVGWFLRGIFRNFKHSIDTLEASVQKYLEIQTNCQKALPERFVSKHDYDLLFAKIDSILDKLSSIPLVYRTKEDANKDWRLLEQRLAELLTKIESADHISQDNYNKIWEKLNRVVDEFRNSRNMVLERQGKIEEIIFTQKEKFELAKQLRECEENNHRNNEL